MNSFTHLSQGDSILFQKLKKKEYYWHKFLIPEQHALQNFAKMKLRATKIMLWL